MFDLSNAVSTGHWMTDCSGSPAPLKSILIWTTIQHRADVRTDMTLFTSVYPCMSRSHNVQSFTDVNTQQLYVDMRKTTWIMDLILRSSDNWLKKTSTLTTLSSVSCRLEHLKCCTGIMNGKGNKEEWNKLQTGNSLRRIYSVYNTELLLYYYYTTKIILVIMW